jgi:hypothetical protein
MNNALNSGYPDAESIRNAVPEYHKIDSFDQEIEDEFFEIPAHSPWVRQWSQDMSQFHGQTGISPSLKAV